MADLYKFMAHNMIHVVRDSAIRDALKAQRIECARKKMDNRASRPRPVRTSVRYVQHPDKLMIVPPEIRTKLLDAFEALCVEAEFPIPPRCRSHVEDILADELIVNANTLHVAADHLIDFTTRFGTLQYFMSPEQLEYWKKHLTEFQALALKPAKTFRNFAARFDSKSAMMRVLADRGAPGEGPMR